MKMLQKTIAASIALTALLAMTACSSSSSSDGGGSGGGSGSLAKGGFVKEVAKDSTVRWGNLPFNIQPVREQHLVHASDIKGSGYIQSFSFKSYATAPETNCPNVTIKMGHTNLNELTTTYASNVEVGKGSLQTVLDRELIIPEISAGAFFTIVLDEPFYYNGTDNLVMEFVTDAGCSHGISIYADNTIHTKADLYALSATATTGSVYDYTADVQLNFAGGVNTQNVEGVVIGNIFPFSTLLKRTQHLYTASDINGSGPITGIAFQLKNPSVAAEYNATVILGHTTLEQFDANNKYVDNYKDTPTIVSDNVHFSIPDGLEANDWFWVPLSGNFNYNGTDNLIVDVKVTAASETNQVLAGNSTGSDNRAYGDVENDIPAGADTLIYHMKFRFNGATMDVITIENAAWGLPFNGSTGYRTQILYGAYELGTSGKVSAFSLRLNNDSAASDYTEASVTLTNTAITSLDQNLSLNTIDSKNVFNGTLKIPAGLKAGDWVTFPVSGFTYDSTKNLVLEITSNSGVNNLIYAASNFVPFGGVVYSYKDTGVYVGSSLGQADLRIMLDK